MELKISNRRLMPRRSNFGNVPTMKKMTRSSEKNACTITNSIFSCAAGAVDGSIHALPCVGHSSFTDDRAQKEAANEAADKKLAGSERLIGMKTMEPVGSEAAVFAANPVPVVRLQEVVVHACRWIWLKSKLKAVCSCFPPVL